MITKIINGILNLLFGFIGVFTSPISSFLNQQFPDLSDAINSAINFIYSLTNVIAYFIYLIPRPFTLSMLSIFLIFVVSTQTTVILIKFSSWCIDLIKRVWLLGGK